MISESVVVEAHNSFNGVTEFEKINLTVGRHPISKYRRVHKDDLGRTVVLEEGEEPPEDILVEQATNFKPTLTYYRFYSDCEYSLGRCELPEMIVRTTWDDSSDKRIRDLSIRKETLTREVAEVLHHDGPFSLAKLWRWYIMAEYQKDANECSREHLFNKYSPSTKAREEVAVRIRIIDSINVAVKNLDNQNIRREFIALLSKPDSVYGNGNTEYYTQRVITTQPLTGKDVFHCYHEILNHLRESQYSHSPLLDGIIESFKEIKDDRGNTVIVLTGYSVVDPKTGFVAGAPRYIEFRVFPPPFRVLTRSQISSRIEQVEKQLERGVGEDEIGLPYFETLEYMQKEKEILEEMIEEWSLTNEPQMIVYLPEILLFHAGIPIESYTYKYDPQKGNGADHYVGLK
ncbi:MAG: hypothetical protein NTX17_03805 [Candidatus Eisenbacteria bacterium]|nr:hypothetical protein [Candidatus Eisenbacteria bacterium]